MNTFLVFALDVLERRREPQYPHKKPHTLTHRPAPQRLFPIMLERKLDTIQTSHYETALRVDMEKSEKNRGAHSEG